MPAMRQRHVSLGAACVRHVQQCSDPHFLMERSILAPRNIVVKEVNSYMLHCWAGQM